MSVENRLRSEGVSAITHSCSWCRCINLQTHWYLLIADTPPSTHQKWVFWHMRKRMRGQVKRESTDEVEIWERAGLWLVDHLNEEIPEASSLYPRLNFQTRNKKSTWICLLLDWKVCLFSFISIVDIKLLLRDVADCLQQSPTEVKRSDVATKALLSLALSSMKGCSILLIAIF